MKNGVLFAAQILEKSHSVGETIQKVAESAVQKGEGNGISERGNKVNPWILKRVSGLSGAKPLPSGAWLVDVTS